MTLFIADMDGTLLNPEGKMSKNSEKILKKLISDGLRFTVATARTPLSALTLLENIPITDPMILMNGALFFDPDKKRFFEPVGLRRESMELLKKAEAVGSRGMLFSVDDKGTLYVNLGDTESELWEGYFHMEKISHIQAISQKIRKCSADGLNGETVVYGLYMDNSPNRLEKMYQILKGNGLTLDYYKDKYTENRWCLEICSAAASKGRAVSYLKELCGEPYMIGFGDSWNDIPMFQVCEETYAMANASLELKDIASGVILSNAEDGVAQYIKEWWENHEEDFVGQSLFAEHGIETQEF